MFQSCHLSVCRSSIQFLVCWEFFYHEWVLNFIKCFISYKNLLIRWITMIDFSDVEATLHSWDEIHLVRWITLFVYCCTNSPHFWKRILYLCIWRKLYCSFGVGVYNKIVWFCYYRMYLEVFAPLLFSGKVSVDLTLFLL